MLPPDLVLQIQVIPKLKFTLDSLGLKEKTLKTLAFSPEKPLKGKTIKATVEVDGIDPDCSKTASSETEIVRR